MHRIAMTDAQEKVRIAMLKILTTNSLRLFGCMIYNFEIHVLRTPTVIPDEYLPYFTAYVKQVNLRPHIYIYDTFISQNDYEELVFVIIHEMIHCIAGHFHRGTSLNRVLWTRACDHVINSPLDKDIKAGFLPRNIRTPEVAFIIEELYDKNMTEEEVYAYLLKKAKVTRINVSSLLVGTEGSSSKGSDGWSGTSTEKMDDYESVGAYGIDSKTQERSSDKDGRGPKDNLDSSEFEVFEVDVDGNKHKVIVFPDTVDEGNDRELSDRLKSEARAVSATLDRSRGISSGSFLEYVDCIIKVELSWEQILEKAIVTRVVPDAENRTWRNPNKKLRQYLMFPGKSFEQRPATLFIGLDTSGSISKNDFSRFLSVVEDSLPHFDQVRIIKHDVEVQEDYIYSSEQFVEVSALEGLFDFRGRGGTSHKHIFQLLEQALEEGEEISLVILLTDFYSDVEEIWDVYEWHQFYPLIVGVCSNKEVPGYIDENPVRIG